MRNRGPLNFSEPSEFSEILEVLDLVVAFKPSRHRNGEISLREPCEWNHQCDDDGNVQFRIEFVAYADDTQFADDAMHD